jgi:two-component system sensor kinase FixL
MEPMTQTSGYPGGADALDTLMDAAVDAIIIIDDVGTIERFNPAAEKLFRYREADVLGRNVSLLMPKPQSINHDGYLQRYKETGRAAIIGRGREETGLRSDGDTFPMLLSVGRIQRDGDVHYVGIIRDLSDIRANREQIRELEEQLLHADRLVILGELTAGIAHEINQPLTAIAAYADAGRKIVDRKDEIQTRDMHLICERIAEQSRRAAEVVQRLRKLVRSGVVSKARHNLNEIIEHAIMLFEFETAKTNIELYFHPLESLEEMFVDEIQIQQILVNLVKNSIDAIAGAGLSDGRIDIRVAKVGPLAEISVTDNGPGVEEALRSKLFEPFFTTKAKGVGLGLSICRNIASAHGGSLQYEAGAPSGSRFTLTLPLEFIG